MATNKKATLRAIKFCQGLTDKKLNQKSTWQQLYDIIMEGFEWSIYTHCKSEGDNTIIQLYKQLNGNVENQLVQTWTLPNSVVYIEDEGDWDWNYLYKLLVEYLVKNLKKINSGKKIRARKKIKEETINVESLMKEVLQIKNNIKEATGVQKKKLIAEYNEKSNLLQNCIEKREKEEKEKQNSLKLSPEELKILRNKKSNLMQKIRNWTDKGKDVTELQIQLKQLTNQLITAKTGLKK